MSTNAKRWAEWRIAYVKGLPLPTYPGEPSPSAASEAARVAKVLERMRNEV